MSYRIRYQSVAARELAEAVQWYEAKAKGLGREFVYAVDAAIKSIKRNPLAHQKMRYDVRRALVRRFPYAVIYRMSSDEIIILSIMHGRRNPKRLRRRIR